MKTTLITIAAVAGLPGITIAANIATGGTGIIGYNSAIDTTLGTSYIRGDQPDGTTVRINDGVYGTNGSFDAVMDTWNGQQTGTEFGYYGVTGITVPGGEQVTDISVNILLAGDGGWFGPNVSGPGNNGILGAPDLIVPTVQITSDGGTTWTSVGASANDYLATLTGATIGGPGSPNYSTVNFTLDTPQTSINGIRLIGSAGGGPAGADQQGFVGLAEFEVNTSAIPEPSGLALLSLAALGLLRRSRR